MVSLFILPPITIDVKIVITTVIHSYDLVLTLKLVLTLERLQRLILVLTLKLVLTLVNKLVSTL